MTLGEKITALRTQYKMSQGDLAEKLNVSRQSISKWETNTSIPELDKLILLSELFHITLDELVKGEKTQDSQQPIEGMEPEIAEPSVQTVPQQTGNARKNIGIILLCFGGLIWLLLTALGGFFSGLLFGSPFLLCGIVCLLFKKNAGLWCAWTIFLTVSLYLRYATGITWRLTLFTLQYEPSMNYMRLAFAWLELLCFVGLSVLTILRLQKTPLTWNKRSKCLYIGGWILLALLFIPVQIDVQSQLANVYYILTDWAKVGLFIALASATVSLIRTHRALNHDEKR